MNKIKVMLLRKYCPDFFEKMPEDKPGSYVAVVVKLSGFYNRGIWLPHPDKIVREKVVEGTLEAYMTARWMALTYGWLHPVWLFTIGINWGIFKNN